MYDIATILQTLESRVGWDPANSPLALRPINSQSDSGLLFQYAHSAISLVRIFETMESVSGIVTEDQFNDKLIGIRNAAILNVVSKVFNQPKLIESSLIWEAYNTDRKVMQATENYVGYNIRAAVEMDRYTTIDSISFLFAEDYTINLELFHSTYGVLWNESFSCTGGKENVFKPENLVINFTDNRFKSGEFFLRYDPNGIKWINPDWINWNKTFNLGSTPYRANGDIITHNSDQCFGLNFRYRTNKDYTRIITDNRELFDQAIMLAVAVVVLEQYIYSDRSNKTERASKEVMDSITNDLNLAIATDSSPYAVGLKAKLDKEIKSLKSNFFKSERITKVSPYVGSKDSVSWRG